MTNNSFPRIRQTCQKSSSHESEVRTVGRKHGRIANGRYGERLYHRAVQEGCGTRPTSRNPFLSRNRRSPLPSALAKYSSDDEGSGLCAIVGRANSRCCAPHV